MLVDKEAGGAAAPELVDDDPTDPTEGAGAAGATPSTELELVELDGERVRVPCSGRWQTCAGFLGYGLWSRQSARQLRQCTRPR